MYKDYTAFTTEAVNAATKYIDECSTEDMLKLINEQDQLVPLAVKKEIPNIAKAVDLLYDHLKSGGSMVYVGAGTSGRLGVLDASECPPTYGTDPKMVQAYIAGGDAALRTSIEGSEDDIEAGCDLVKSLGLTEKDVLVAITASGRAPFVVGAARQAKLQGAATIAVVNNEQTEISSICDITIAPIVGPEVIAGSTRMKCGTAQKLVLNMLSTGTMIKLGKVYGNLMVDLKASNSKLYRRAVRIVQSAAGVDEQTALEALKKADMSAKKAILMLKTNLTCDEANRVLEISNGNLKRAIHICEKGQ